MRENFNRNKRAREESKKKKRLEKAQKELARNTVVSNAVIPEQSDPLVSPEIPSVNTNTSV